MEGTDHPQLRDFAVFAFPLSQEKMVFDAYVCGGGSVHCLDSIRSGSGRGGFSGDDGNRIPSPAQSETIRRRNIGDRTVGGSGKDGGRRQAAEAFEDAAGNRKGAGVCGS